MTKPIAAKHIGLRKYIFLLVSLMIFGSCATSKTENTQNKKYIEYQAIIDSIYQVNPKSFGIMVHIESPKKRI